MSISIWNSFQIGINWSKLFLFFNKIEITIRNLKLRGIRTSSYGSLLIPMLTSKLPTDLRTLFTRKFTGNIWLLDELLVFLKNELEAKERSVSPWDKHFERSEFSRYRSTTSSFHTGSEFIKSNCDYVVPIIKTNNISKKSLLYLYDPETSQ